MDRGTKDSKLPGTRSKSNEERRLKYKIKVRHCGYIMKRWVKDGRLYQN